MPSALKTKAIGPHLEASQRLTLTFKIMFTAICDGSNDEASELFIIYQIGVVLIGRHTYLPLLSGGTYVDGLNVSVVECFFR